jgi:hypothetical protein
MNDSIFDAPKLVRSHEWFGVPRVPSTPETLGGGVEKDSSRLALGPVGWPFLAGSEEFLVWTQTVAKAVGVKLDLPLLDFLSTLVSPCTCQNGRAANSATRLLKTPRQYFVLFE